MDKEMEKMRQVQKELWDVVNNHIGPEDRSNLLMLSGSMIKIAIELYTVILEDDDIEGVLEVVANDLPQIRAKMSEKIGERVLH